MTIVIALSIILPSLLAGCSENHDHADDGKSIYTCSMHPQIRSNKPGRCPICGMNLTPLKQEQPAADMTPEKSSKNNSVRLMPAQDSVASVVTAPVVLCTLTHPVTVFGEIQYIQDTHVDYTWVYSGRIEKLFISYNTTEVRRGQPLVEIYSEEAIADQQAYLQAVRDRYLTTFYERKVVSAQIEAFRSKLLRAGMTDDELDRLIKNKTIKTHFTITAPISGSIIQPIPRIGERISSGTVLFPISALDKVWFTAKVFEQDISALSLNQEIEIEAKSRPGHKYRGKLVFIDRAIEPETRTLSARFEIENPKRELLPNMSAAGYIQVKTTGEVLAVPTSAIIDTGKRKILYVKTDSQSYQQREITMGTDGFVEGKSEKFTSIVKGLDKDDQVVTSGAFLIDAEAQLRGNAPSEKSHNH